jgi:hypothetical protein
MWTIIYLCLWKGIKLTSRVAVFTALFPYLPMFALFIRGITLDGAWSGLKYYLVPDIQRLLNKKTWTQAAGKILIRKNKTNKILFIKIKDMFFGHMVLVGVLFQLYQVIIVLIIIFIVILL